MFLPCTWLSSIRSGFVFHLFNVRLNEYSALITYRRFVITFCNHFGTIILCWCIMLWCTTCNILNRLSNKSQQTLVSAMTVWMITWCSTHRHITYGTLGIFGLVARATRWNPLYRLYKIRHFLSHGNAPVAVKNIEKAPSGRAAPLRTLTKGAISKTLLQSTTWPIWKQLPN